MVTSAIAIDLHHLRLALSYICPDTDWSWLATITKRIAAQAQPKPRETSSGDQRTALRARDRTHGPSGQQFWRRNLRITKADAFDYRDGLIIALLALVAVTPAHARGSAHRKTAT